MKIRTTNAYITDLKNSVERAIEASKQKRPINLHAQILEAASPAILEQVRTCLNPDKFEALIKWYFQRVGASEAYIPSKNESGKEGDADVIAIFEPLKTVFYNQVKFHSGETSKWALEQIKAYKDSKERMDDGYSKIYWVVSSADDFSEECYALATDSKVQLINGPHLAQMLLEVGLSDLDAAI